MLHQIIITIIINLLYTVMYLYKSFKLALRINPMSEYKRTHTHIGNDILLPLVYNVVQYYDVHIHAFVIDT